MRSSDWSSDVFSSDLVEAQAPASGTLDTVQDTVDTAGDTVQDTVSTATDTAAGVADQATDTAAGAEVAAAADVKDGAEVRDTEGNLVGTIETVDANRSEEQTTELQSLMRISYAVLCL